MKKQLIYKDLAKYYDLIYSWKDYKKESEKVKALISKYKKSEGNRLLEVACGTGRHLEHLRNDFSCTGIDISSSMLKVARKRLEGITFKKADMVNFNPKKKFDVITCLFSSIGYVKTYSNLNKTIQNFARHLKKGVVVVIEPWFQRATYELGTPHMTIYEDEDTKVARVSISKIKGNISIVDMHYLIGEKDKEIKYFVDRHEVGLFDVDKTLDIMKKSGFQAKFLKQSLTLDRGIFVGIKK